jgi:magnesium-transporting ATPase (P-type)
MKKSKKRSSEQELDPPKTKSMKAQALENVFHQIELERQSVELREFLIYHTDPALGAVWSRFEEEYAKLNEENERQIELERQLEMQRKWQRRKRLNNLHDKALIIGAVLTLTIYLHLLLWSIKANDNGQIVFLISLIVVVLILPLFLYLMASMYFDMLVLQQENKQQQAIIRRLIIELENKK